MEVAARCRPLCQRAGRTDRRLHPPRSALPRGAGDGPRPRRSRHQGSPRPAHGLPRRQQRAAVEPTDDDLEALRRAEPERFALPGTISFEHVFYNAERRGPDAARAEAERTLAALQSASPPDPNKLGDPFLLPKRFDALRADQAARTFGDAFTGALAAAPRDEWFGPVPSVYGLHLVRVSASTPPGLPPLDQIRDRLRTEWLARRERAAAAAYEADLRAKYEVVIQPDPTPAPAKPGAQDSKAETP
ncbi:MAG: peptidyl-prolyl cis-trans isomerase [Phycisphaerales bacterium]|nr:peptidyl-prolyl cis-trans isomerase [Phycisphaerales bacterium]